jgi:hypothetical protein
MGCHGTLPECRLGADHVPVQLDDADALDAALALLSPTEHQSGCR